MKLPSLILTALAVIGVSIGKVEVDYATMWIIVALALYLYNKR